MIITNSLSERNSSSVSTIGSIAKLMVFKYGVQAGKNWSKRLSVVVIYVDHPIEKRVHYGQFDRVLHWVDHYIFDR